MWINTENPTCLEMDVELRVAQFGFMRLCGFNFKEDHLLGNSSLKDLAVARELANFDQTSGVRVSGR